MGMNFPVLETEGLGRDYISRTTSKPSARDNQKHNSNGLAQDNFFELIHPF